MTAISYRRQPGGNFGLLVAFVLLYPLVFFPGALFSRPVILTDGVIADAAEQFLYLPKLLFLLAVAALGALEGAKRIRSQRLSRFDRWFLGAMLAHALLCLASSLNARDTLTFTLLGPQLRFDGLIYQLSLAALGVYAYLTLRDNRPGLSWIGTALIATGCVQTLIILLQRLGADPITPLRQYVSAEGFINGTLGHPGMVAALLLPALILALWRCLQPLRSRPYWIFAVAVIGAGLGITGNSAAFYALIFVLLLLNLLRRDRLLLALSLLTLASVLVPREILPSQQLAQEDYRNTSTLQTRLIIWQITLKAIAATPLQPVVGGGADGLGLALLRNPPLDDLVRFLAIEHGWPSDAKVDRVLVEKLPDGGLRDQWIKVSFSSFGGQSKVDKTYPFGLDRAHNFFLDRWVAFGLLSALLWLGLYLWPLWKGRRGSPALSWALLALMVYYLAWFPVMQVEPIHLILLAGAWAGLEPQPSPHTPQT